MHHDYNTNGWLVFLTCLCKWSLGKWMIRVEVWLTKKLMSVWHCKMPPNERWQGNGMITTYKPQIQIIRPLVRLSLSRIEWIQTTTVLETQDSVCLLQVLLASNLSHNQHQIEEVVRSSIAYWQVGTFIATWLPTTAWTVMHQKCWC